MATGNMNKNLVKIGHVVFELCERTDKQKDKQTDKQTNKQKTYTHHSTAVLRASPGAK